MTFNKKLLAATLLTAGGFAAISSANAGTFQVAMTVEKSCVVTAGNPIALAGKSDAGAPAAISSTFQVACSNTTPYSVSMTPTAGSTNEGESKGTLKPADTTANTATLDYQLTTDALGATPWAAGTLGNTTGTGGTGTGTAGNKDFTVYAKVTGTNINALIPGIYKDTVTIGVNY